MYYGNNLRIVFLFPFYLSEVLTISVCLLETYASEITKYRMKKSHHTDIIKIGDNSRYLSG
jgi:hypothetical protein